MLNMKYIAQAMLDEEFVSHLALVTDTIFYKWRYPYTELKIMSLWWVVLFAEHVEFHDRL